MKTMTVLLSSYVLYLSLLLIGSKVILTCEKTPVNQSHPVLHLDPLSEG